MALSEARAQDAQAAMKGLAIEPAKQIQESTPSTLMLRCYGGRPENGRVRKGEYIIGIQLNFDTRLAVIGEWTLEMAQINNLIMLRSRDGKMIGIIDQLTRRAFVQRYDADDKLIYAIEFDCEQAHVAF
jgi:hypothetical protein